MYKHARVIKNGKKNFNSGIDITTPERNTEKVENKYGFSSTEKSSNTTSSNNRNKKTISKNRKNPLLQKKNPIKKRSCNRNCRKQCGICGKFFQITEYDLHVIQCRKERESRKISKNIKKKSIHEILQSKIENKKSEIEYKLQNLHIYANQFIQCPYCKEEVNVKVRNYLSHLEKRHNTDVIIDTKLSDENARLYLSEYQYKRFQAQRKRDFIKKLYPDEREESEDLFDRKKVLSGGGFGLGKSNKY